MFAAALTALAALAASSCTEDITLSAGALPGGGQPVVGELRSVSAPGSTVEFSLAGETAGDMLYYQFTQPNADAALTVAPDLSLVDAWNAANNTQYLPFPLDNVTLAGGGALSFPDGALRSAQVGLTLLQPDEWEMDFSNRPSGGHTYLLPLRVGGLPEGIASDEAVLYYVVRSEPMPPWPVLEADPQLTCVAYLRVDKYKPMLAMALGMMDYDRVTWESFAYRFVDILNLQRAELLFDPASGRAKLGLGPDISYVLTHPRECTAQVRSLGAKVCVAIHTSATSDIGFCNMTDAQIADFAGQVAAAIHTGQLDGVNLWDGGTSYARAGAPPMTLTSYPKLIKALRDAMPGKLITVTDVGDPTATFDQAHGGITVGGLIDYAWTGEELELVWPWADDATRKPIAGLDKTKYGQIMAVPVHHDYIPIEKQDEIIMGLIDFLERGEYNVAVLGDFRIDAVGAESQMPMAISNYLFAPLTGIDFMGPMYQPTIDEFLPHYGLNYPHYEEPGVYWWYYKDW